MKFICKFLAIVLLLTHVAWAEEQQYKSITENGVTYMLIPETTFNNVAKELDLYPAYKEEIKQLDTYRLNCDRTIAEQAITIDLINTKEKAWTTKEGIYKEQLKNTQDQYTLAVNENADLKKKEIGSTWVFVGGIVTGVALIFGSSYVVKNMK